MSSILILNAIAVNEGKTFETDIYISEGKIQQLGSNLSGMKAENVVDAAGKHVFPGMIDDQVHFREPGLTYKADIASESIAAIAGGTTSFMDMPNNEPPIITNEQLKNKYKLASGKAHANYAFYLGATNSNIEEIKNVDVNLACGVKVFMGSSTGNMLVDDPQALNQIFKESPILIATHCEDSPTIDKNLEEIKKEYGDNIPIELHPKIRSREACEKSSKLAVELAKKYNSRLHILHLTTHNEIDLFDHGSLEQKRITAEVCVHHLYFSDSDYAEKQGLIKCNPAIKTLKDREALIKAVKSGQIDIIATDHAPHTLEEKQGKYENIGAGLPIIQHSFQALLELWKKGILPLETVIEKTSHAPAICFNIKERGFLREGYWADIVIVDTACSEKIERHNVLHKCGWSAFENFTFNTKIHTTIVSGKIAFHDGKIQKNIFGMPLEFSR
jgi:dihydroorotase